MKYYQLFIIGICIILSSCFKKDEITQNTTKGKIDSFDDVSIPEGFNFNMFELRELKIGYVFDNEWMNIQIYNHPSLKKEYLLFHGDLKKDQVHKFKFDVPKSCQFLWVVSHTPGANSFYKIPFDALYQSIDLSTNYSLNEPELSQTSNERSQAIRIPINKRYGFWDSNGVPNYLSSIEDEIDQQFIDDIVASLPDGQDVEVHSNNFITPIIKDIILTGDAEISITFFHENATYRNALGYYTYDTSTPPSSVNDIDSVHLIFPNSSYLNSGGGLETGDKVVLGEFTAGTGIGFVLIENGWMDHATNINIWGDAKYSNHHFNSFAEEEKKQHMLALTDIESERVILGFEDVSRNISYSDQDFNDVIFYANIFPFHAFENNFPNLKESIDIDGDGVVNMNDLFPEDPERAFIIQSPISTLVFEDNWPSKGDYDFNDLVLYTDFKKIISGSYHIKDISLKLKINAVGGYYRNGFGFEFPFDETAISSVTGIILNEGIITTSEKGAELGGLGKSSIITFENATDLMVSLDDPLLVNVIENLEYVEPFEQEIFITLHSDVIDNSMISGLPNPFIFIAKDRGREVHLPNEFPTVHADTTFFGRNDDETDMLEMSTYKTSGGAPWVLKIPGDFKYPEENINISHAYPNFNNWVESAGTSSIDWYTENSSELLYTNSN